jgi:hypothetical protein
MRASNVLSASIWSEILRILSLKIQIRSADSDRVEGQPVSQVREEVIVGA